VKENLVKREMSSKQNYNAIDIARVIFAILVVSAHVKPLGNVDEDSFLGIINFFIQKYMARIAVPFFFVSSGFFLYRKMYNKREIRQVSVAYIKRLLRQYFIWSIIYLPLSVEEFLGHKWGWYHSIKIYIRNVIFAGSFIHLWFLPALVFSIILVSFMLIHDIHPKVIVLVAFLFYIMGLLGQSWYGMILPIKGAWPELWTALKRVGAIIVTTRDGLFDGFLYVAIGMYLAVRNVRLKMTTAIEYFCMSMVAMLAEVLLLQYIGFICAYEMFLFAVPATLFLFLFLIELYLNENDIYKDLRIISKIIYFSHFWIYVAIKRLFSKIHQSMADSCLVFIFTLLFAFLLSFVVMKVSRNKMFSWLKILYT